MSGSILSNSPNHLLRSLSPEDADLLQPRLRLVDLPSRTVLYSTGNAVQRVYFPYTGIVCCTVGTAHGEIVDAGMVGRNSAVGAAFPLDGSKAINDAMAQTAVSAGVVEVNFLKQFVVASSTLRACFVRHLELALAQAQQLVACNALHSLDERLSRWLLQARDLLNVDVLPLTHDFLSQMLGVHRSSLTLVARRLQEAGLIDYRHGNIRVRDVAALRDVSCDCYATMNAHLSRIIDWSPDFDG